MPTFGRERDPRFSVTSLLELIVSPSKTGAGSRISSHPRLAKTFWEISVTLWPVTRATVKVESTRGRPYSAQWMIVDVTHLEVLEKASPPPLFDRHATPPEFGLW